MNPRTRSRANASEAVGPVAFPFLPPTNGKKSVSFDVWINRSGGQRSACRCQPSPPSAHRGPGPVFRAIARLKDMTEPLRQGPFEVSARTLRLAKSRICVFGRLAAGTFAAQPRLVRGGAASAEWQSARSDAGDSQRANSLEKIAARAVRGLRSSSALPRKDDFGAGPSHPARELAPRSDAGGRFVQPVVRPGPVACFKTEAERKQSGTR